MDVESKTDDGVQTIKKEIDIKECSVKNVTVFTDRAEVNRLIDLDLTKGNVEVLLKGLPVCVDNDSIRYHKIRILIITILMRAFHFDKIKCLIFPACTNWLFCAKKNIVQLMQYNLNHSFVKLNLIVLYSLYSIHLYST